jgi:hypothetical protein
MGKESPMSWWMALLLILVWIEAWYFAAIGWYIGKWVMGAWKK